MPRPSMIIQYLALGSIFALLLTMAFRREFIEEQLIILGIVIAIFAISALWHRNLEEE